MRGLKGKKAWHPSEAGADVVGDGEWGGVYVWTFVSNVGAAEGGSVVVKGACVGGATSEYLIVAGAREVWIRGVFVLENAKVLVTGAGVGEAVTLIPGEVWA
jgi:hypothetical protein